MHKSSPFRAILYNASSELRNRKAVSYTHLDVYKRQLHTLPSDSFPSGNFDSLPGSRRAIREGRKGYRQGPCTPEREAQCTSCILSFLRKRLKYMLLVFPAHTNASIRYGPLICRNSVNSFCII